MIPAPYETTQKALLVAEVATLSGLLNRPVSSKDLEKRWKELPGNRPLLTQRTGQNLIKAARPVNGDNPVLHKIGIIGNLAFYAEDDSPYWNERFRLHELRCRALWHVQWNIPMQAQFLLGTEHENLALNALAGFVAEWAKHWNSEVLPDTFAALWETAVSNVAHSFHHRCPVLAPRKDAARMILDEVERRHPFFEGGLNINRHLARMVWPQSPLFSEEGYWLAQIEHYCASMWPDDTEDPLVSKALWLCGAYGEVGG